MEARVACIEEAGFDAGLTPDESGESVNLNVIVPNGMDDEVDRIVDECEAKVGEGIVAAYERRGSLTGAAREKEMEALVACLDKAGVTGLSVTETDSRVFVNAIVSYGLDSPESDAGFRCLDRHPDVWPVGDANNPAP